MPKKRKSGGGASGRSGRKGKAKRASARKERKSGLYLSPGDADYKQLSEQLSREGLALRDVPGDGWVCIVVEKEGTCSFKSCSHS